MLVRLYNTLHDDTIAPGFIAPRRTLLPLQRHLLRKEAPTSLVQLEQSLLPAILPPPPTDKLLTKIAGKQVKTAVQCSESGLPKTKFDHQAIVAVRFAQGIASRTKDMPLAGDEYHG